jgi:hypothetical protein
MNRKRSILLSAGAVLAASLIANAASPEAPGASPAREIKPASHECATASHEKECATASQESAPASSSESAPASFASAPASFASSPASFASAPASQESASASHPVAPASHVSAGGAPAALPRSPGSTASPASVDDRVNQPNTVLTPTGLATTDTILSYCAQIDGKSSAQYLSGITMITQGHDNAETAAIRSMPEYSKTQVALNAQLAKVAYGSGISACRLFASGSNHRISGFSTPIRTPMGSDK